MTVVATWRDRITLVDALPGFASRQWTPTGRATAESALDYLDPILGLSLLPMPVVIGWQNVAGTWNAQAAPTWVGIRDVAGTWQDRGFWEQSLTHELVHVVDAQMMNDADRASVMAALSSPPDPVLSGVHATRNWLDHAQPYASNAGEAFAEGISRHWWFVERNVLAEADLDAWGMYTYDPTVALPAMKAALDAALARRRAVLAPKPVTPPAPVPPKPPTPPKVVPMTVAPKWLPSPNFTRGREAPITDIVIHWMAGTLANTDAEFSHGSRKVSAHYGIEGAVVHQYVKDTDTAWHAGDRGENHRSIGIEHSAAPGRDATPVTIGTSIALMVDLCRTHNISPDHIYPHKKFYATACPGTLPIAAMIAAVRAQLTQPASTPTPATNTEQIMADLTLTNPATKVDASAASGLSSIWAYTFLNYKMLVALGAKAGVDVDEKALAAELTAMLVGPLRDALAVEVTTGATPEAIADAVIARITNGPSPTKGA